MANIDTTRPAAGLTASAMSNAFTRAFSALAEWNDARITRKALGRLSERELEDIGLTRGDIDIVARRGIR